MRKLLDDQQGSASVFIVIGVVLLVIVAFVFIQLFPLYWDHWNVEDTIKNDLMSSLVPPYTEVQATVTQKIIRLLDDIGAQYQEEYVRVEVAPNNSKIFVEVWYNRPHHLPFYQNPKQFYLKREHATLLPKINLPTRAPLPNIE